jgi:hypothetical protein
MLSSVKSGPTVIKQVHDSIQSAFNVTEDRVMTCVNSSNTFHTEGQVPFVEYVFSFISVSQWDTDTHIHSALKQQCHTNLR